jgi:hypothetical protein
MDFPSHIATKARRVRPGIGSTTAALRFIDQELLPDQRLLSHWTFARELLVAAERSGNKRDLTDAFRQFRQALSNDRLLKER